MEKCHHETAMANTKLSHRTRHNLTQQTLWSYTEILAENGELNKPELLYSEVEPQKTAQELEQVTRLIQKEPLFTIHRRGGEA